MKRFLAILISSLMLMGSANIFAAPNTRYVLNNKEVSINADSLIQDGIIYLPAIETFKACGYYVKATSDSITAMAIGKPGYVSIWVGKKTAVLNGQSITLGTAPFFKNGVCYVSSRFIEEQTGVSVCYVSEKKTIYINSKNTPEITSTASQTVNISNSVNIDNYIGRYTIHTDWDIAGTIWQTKDLDRDVEIKKQSNGKYVAFVDTTRSHTRKVEMEYAGNGIFTSGKSSDTDSSEDYKETPGYSDDISITIKNGNVYVNWSCTKYMVERREETKRTINKTYIAEKTNAELGWWNLM